MSRERVWYFDFLRIFAMFAVVMVHISAQNWHAVSTNSFEWNVFNVYDSLVRWGVPIFTMISGALFLSRDQKISKIFKKNILRLFIALMFWSTIYTLLRVFNHKIDGVGEFIFNVLKGGNVHLWFLYMLIGLYAIVPLLRKIVKDKKLAIYFVALSLIFAFLIPEIIYIVEFIHPSLAEKLRIIVDAFQIKFVMG